MDWARRFDYMQQHTGQHVLSAAIDRVCGVRTEVLHLGADTATIDLTRELTTAEIAASEEAANDVVWADRPVTIRFVDAADAASLGLRKESVRTGTLRIIEVEGFDVSACGGTHVGRTGAIGVIAISGWERFRGGTRLEFKCGGRASATGAPDAPRYGSRQQRAVVHHGRRVAPGDRTTAERRQRTAAPVEGG